MKRFLATVVALAAIVVLVVAVSASGKQPKQHGKEGHHGKAITVIEHATSDTTTDTGASGDSVGDVLTFANDVFDPSDTNKVGTDQGYCLRVVAGASYECTWTTLPARRSDRRLGPLLRREGQHPRHHRRHRALPRRARHDGPALAQRRSRVRVRLPPRRLSQAMRPPHTTGSSVHPPANGPRQHADI